MEEVSGLVIRKLEAMTEAAEPRVICSKRKAISALLPHAVRLAGSGKQQMIGVFSRVAEASDSEGFIWHSVEPFMATLFDKPRTAFLDRTITLVSPYLDWDRYCFDKNMVTRWSTAALAVPYTEVVGRSVVDALWRIVCTGTLQPHIPIRIWSWSNSRTFLPPIRLGQFMRTWRVICQIRALEDIDILKSYFLLVWSDWRCPEDSALIEMHNSVKRNFNGIGMGCHRGDLIDRLDHVLGQLDQGPEYLKKHRPDLDFSVTQDAKGHYRELKEALLEMDREATEILTRTPSRFVVLFDLLTPADMYRISPDIHV